MKIWLERMMKRLLTIISLGIGIWGLSLLWPHLNLLLTPETMAAAIAGLATALLMYFIIRDSNQHRPDGRNGKDRYSRPKLVQLNHHS
jgi:hypothetical protein